MTLKNHLAKTDAYGEVLKIVNECYIEVKQWIDTHHCEKGKECMNDCSEQIMRWVGRKNAYSMIIEKIERLEQQENLKYWGN